MTARIVTTTYRYKPPPKRKGRKLAEITGPAVVPAKGSRRPVRLGEAAAEVEENANARPERAGDIKSSTLPGKTPAPANDDRKSAIVTAGDRKTVQRQREQQQMARIVTYVPKRQQDAWARYLRLTGLTDPDAPQPP